MEFKLDVLLQNFTEKHAYALHVIGIVWFTIFLITVVSSSIWHFTRDTFGHPNYERYNRINRRTGWETYILSIVGIDVLWFILGSYLQLNWSLLFFIAAGLYGLFCLLKFIHAVVSDNYNGIFNIRESMNKHSYKMDEYQTKIENVRKRYKKLIKQQL